MRWYNEKMDFVKGKIFLLVIFLFFGFFIAGEVTAGATDNVSGWSWSENIGWISFNCNNSELPAPRCTNDYGVNINPSTGNFSGYAWSENIGWIDFAPAGPYPTTPNYSACLDFPGAGQTCDGVGDYKVSGWAKVLSNNSWIKLKDGNYGVSWNTSTQEMEGWAWSDTDVGWISFNCLNQGVCGTSNYKVIAQLDITAPGPPTRAPTSRDWDNTDVLVTVNYTDNLTGITYTRHCWTTMVSCDPETTATSTFQNGGSVTQTATGAWTLCTRARDGAGNWSSNHCSAQGAYKVDKQEPNSQIQSPASNSWFSDDFTLDTLDEDLESGLDTGQCQYKIIPYEDTNGDGIADTERTSSGWLSRTCNAPPNSPVTTITVGPTDYCRYQAKSSCWVYIRSKDITSNWHLPTQPKGSIKLYNIDWTDPEPGKLYITGTAVEQTYPILVQLNREYTFKTDVTDNLKVTACNLYIDNIDQGAMAPTVPGCERNCTFTKNFTFTGTGTYNNNYARCRDAAGNVKSGTAVQIQSHTLSVSLVADPSSGTILTNFDLVATVSGTMPGTINYKFDCTNDGTWELEVNNTSTNPYRAVDLCNYPSPATYIAKVLIERGTGNSQATTSINVVPNQPPSASSLSVDSHNPADYCGVTAYPPVRVRWQFQDPDPGDYQSAYQIQVFRQADGSLAVDTGIITDTCPGNCASYVFQEAGKQLNWNTAYTWQIKVWDNNDAPSNWVAGPNFTTASHAYPKPNFAWTPSSPSVNELIQFTDQTTYYNSLGTWNWSFGDGTFSTQQNPSKTYSTAGTYSVGLQVTDGSGYGPCSISRDVTIALPLPEWMEIPPF